jgi:hypothetical protein
MDGENGSIPIDEITDIAEEIRETVGDKTQERTEQERDELKEQYDLEALETTDRTLPFQTLTTPEADLLFVAPLPESLSLTDFDMNVNKIGNLDVVLIYEDGLGHLVEYEISKEQVDRVNQSNRLIPIAPSRYEELVEDEKS